MSALSYSRRSLLALPVLLALAGGIFFYSSSAQALSVGAGQGVQFARIAVTYAKTKACTAAQENLAIAKTDPYYRSDLASYDHTFRNDYWLFYQYKKVTDAIDDSASTVRNLCANVTTDQDYSAITKDTQLSSTTTASTAGAGNAKQLAKQAVALAKAGRCEQADVMIDKAQSAMSLKTSGYVGQGTAPEVINAQMQVSTLCQLTGQAATDASIASAAAGGADTSIATNKAEAEKRLETAYMVAQSVLAQARQGLCDNVKGLLPTIEESVRYYLNGNVSVMESKNVAAVKNQAANGCNLAGTSSVPGTAASTRATCSHGGATHAVNTSWYEPCTYTTPDSSGLKYGCMMYYCVPASSLTGAAIQEGLSSCTPGLACGTTY